MRFFKRGSRSAPLGLLPPLGERGGVTILIATEEQVNKGDEDLNRA